MKMKAISVAAFLVSASVSSAMSVWTGAVNDWDWNEAGNFQGSESF